MHYLITGHTGFKGAWLTLLLRQRGHDVSGYALDPVAGGIFESASVAGDLLHDFRGDVRDRDALTEALATAKPDVVVHMAAQPLVRESYRDPRETFDVNVMGTLSVLEAVSATPSVRAHVVVTTDKVYQNVGRPEGYREDEPLGAADPYSTSKAMADLLIQSWVFSTAPRAATTIARAGNVIGGGDVSPDRLLPDVIRAFAAHRPVVLRNPSAVRPWQHVLDCVAGYATLADASLAMGTGGAWNFGPGHESFVTVGEVASLACSLWGDGATWELDGGSHPHEAHLLSLDASKAVGQLAWRNALPYPACLEWTLDWHRAVESGSDARELSLAQITDFERLRVSEARA